MSDYVLPLFRVEKRGLLAKRFRIDHFVDHDIRALGEAYEVFGVTSISRKDDRASSKIDTVAQSRLHHAMIDCKRRNFHSVALVDHTFADILGHNLHRRAGKFLIHVAPDVYVELISLGQVRHHIVRAWWPPDSDRHFPSSYPA